MAGIGEPRVAGAIFGRATTLCLVLATIGAEAPSGAAMTPVDRGRVVLRDYALCLISRDDRPLVGDRTRPRISDIDKFLSLSPLSREGSSAARVLNTERCVQTRDHQPSYVTLAFQPQLLRGAIFRAKFERAMARQPLPEFPEYNSAARWHFPPQDKFAVLQAIGECTVRANPEATRAAIESRVDSAEENRAYAALTPALSRCIPGSGEFTFSRALLESVFAEALYQLTAETSADRTK